MLHAVRPSERPLALTVAALLTLGSGNLLAADTKRGEGQRARQVEQLSAEGVALYRRGAHREAIEKFRTAYGLYPLPALLYNLGRSFEALGEFDVAMAYFRRCMRQAKPGSRVAAKSKSKLLMLERARREADFSARPSPKGTAVSAARPGPPAGGRRGWSLNAAKWTSGALGMGLLVAGSVLVALGASDNGTLRDGLEETDAQGRASISQPEAQDLQHSARTKLTAGYALWGVGGALTITSALLFVFDRPAAAESAATGNNVHFALTAAPGSAGATVYGAF